MTTKEKKPNTNVGSLFPGRKKKVLRYSILGKEVQTNGISSLNINNLLRVYIDEAIKLREDDRYERQRSIAGQSKNQMGGTFFKGTRAKNQ